MKALEVVGGVLHRELRAGQSPPAASTPTAAAAAVAAAATFLLPESLRPARAREAECEGRGEVLELEREKRQQPPLSILPQNSERAAAE